MKNNLLKIGVNLGGWLSQYKEFDHRHFQTFITKDDLCRIADWGFDHVRLPVDYPVLEDDANPGVYLESGFAYLDRCLTWCQENALRLIFDIHNAPGYSFTKTLEVGEGVSNSLFADPSLQQRFINLWDSITRRYAGQFEDVLAFELLNEVVLSDGAPWNRLSQQTIEHIRGIDSQRLIIVGGNNYNAVDELSNIHLTPDPNLTYTFHFYEPLVITHQKAPWVIEMEQFNQTTDYPGEASGLAEYLQTRHPNQAPRYQASFNRRLDRQLLVDLLEPAIRFKKHSEIALYCGEFGVIDRAPMQTRINWTRDVIDILNEYDIGYAYWSYKQMDFGLVDENGMAVNEELVRVVCGRG